MIACKTQYSWWSACFVALVACQLSLVFGEGSRRIPRWLYSATRPRGGSTTSVRVSDVYLSLAKALQPRLFTESGTAASVNDIINSFKALASAQQTFKGLDGAAHETYQRTHEANVDGTVSGRAQRSAARASAAADALGACELCELLENPQVVSFASATGALVGRQVLLNKTSVCELNGVRVGLLVLYEESYAEGMGVYHGGIGDVPVKMRRADGRLIVIIGDSACANLAKTIQYLTKEPTRVRLTQGPMTGEVASVQTNLFQSAAIILAELEPIVRGYNTSAIHITGRSLGGGVAAVVAAMLHGSLPLHQARRKKKRVTSASAEREIAVATNSSSNVTVAPLQGLAKGRVSAVLLGAPPSMSANVPTEFILSILFGDDVVPRTSNESLDRLVRRTRRNIKKGAIGRQLGFVTDTFSLAASNLRNHAHGSEGEETRLAIPGRAYLVRPRRLGGTSSMHEIGGQLKGGREAVRAAVLWQLNDILLTKSLWKHHRLEAYIHGLDRMSLRGFDNKSLE